MQPRWKPGQWTTIQRDRKRKIKREKDRKTENRKTERQRDRKTDRQKDTTAYFVDEQRCDPDGSEHNREPDKSPEGLVRSNVEPAMETRLFTVFFDCHFESVYINEE
jgi:hypothetical protein